MIRTKSGTVRVDGIEYNEYPTTATLIKAMDSTWAIKLREEGVIRLNSVLFYQKLESEELGDRNEGLGMLRLDGHELNMGTANEVFIWCAALPGTPKETLLGLDKNYDCIVAVSNTQELVSRLSQALKEKGLKMDAHIGFVNYNRGNEVSSEELELQKFNYNIFQKSKEYRHQREFRISFSNLKLGIDVLGSQPIDLTLGDCKELIAIEST